MEIDEFLAKAAAKEATKIDAFRTVTKNWVVNAQDALNGIEAICRNCGESQKIAERHQLLKHYLNCLEQLCEDRIQAYTAIKIKESQESK